MSAPDWLLLAVVVVSTVTGLLRGFIAVLASLVAWLLGGWVAFRYGGEAAIALAGGPPGPGELLAGYGLSLVAVLLLVGIVSFALRMLVRSVGLSGVDRTLGLVIGAARGLLLACGLVLLMGFTSLPEERAWQESNLVEVLVPGAEWLRAWLPPWAAAQVDFSDAPRRGVLERTLAPGRDGAPAGESSAPAPDLSTGDASAPPTPAGD